MDKKRKLRLFIILAVLILLFVNITLISGYIIINSYGRMYLSPGEDYIVNIPFKLFQSPVVHGTALDNNGNPLSGIRVIINNSNNPLVGEDITDSNGEYSINLPEISEREQFYVYLEYDNETSGGDSIALGSNDYDYTFQDINYSKSLDSYIELVGHIDNEDARIENGRIIVTLNKCEGDTNNCNELIDVKNDIVNIEPQETYDIPNSQVEFKWSINNLQTGKYQFEVSMSFNGIESNSLANYVYVIP